MGLTRAITCLDYGYLVTTPLHLLGASPRGSAATRYGYLVITPLALKREITSLGFPSYHP